MKTELINRTEPLHISLPAGIKSTLARQAKARGLCMGQYYSKILGVLAADDRLASELYHRAMSPIIIEISETRLLGNLNTIQ
jgi:hypothetical protein